MRPALFRIGTVVVALSLTSAILPAQDRRVATPEVERQEGEAAWAKLEALIKEPRAQTEDKRAALLADEQRRRQIADLALDAYLKLPDDPRRWTAMYRYLLNTPRFITEVGADYATAGTAAVKHDTVGYKLTQIIHDEMWAKIDALEEAPPDVARVISSRRIGRGVSELRDRAKRGESVDFTEARAALGAHLRQFPDDTLMPAFGVSNYMSVYESVFPGKALDEWARLAELGHPQLTRLARAKLKEFALPGQQVELKFTALDGREVDLAKLRGKVVLIDFWATWCGPCIAEQPNLKRVYAAYHGKGFEIVGIALENARLAPDDTPEQQAAKLAKAREVLTSFIAKHELAWPHYFDGRKHNEGGNALAERFGVSAIPAMFLVDQSGVIVATNVRGPKLEAEVRRLLGL